jgi:hypothetical protein
MHMQEHLERWHSIYIGTSEVRSVLLSVLKVLERDCGLQHCLANYPLRESGSINDAVLY